MRRDQKSLPSAQEIMIKRSKKTGITKFKLRTPKYLLTLKVNDKSKADKIVASIPPSKSCFLLDGLPNQYKISSFSYIYMSLTSLFLDYNRPQEKLEELSNYTGMILHRLVNYLLKKQ